MVEHRERVEEGGFSLIWYLTKFSMKLNERLGLDIRTVQ